MRLRFSPSSSWLVALAASLACSSTLTLPSVARSQTLEQSATYVSQIDEDLTIRRVAVLPVVDNVEGIYARPIEAQLINLIRSSHRWDFVEANVAGSLPGVTELEENPAEVQRITQTIEADAVFVAAASRGPTGLALRLNLFLRKDGKLLAQETLRDHPRFEIPELREQVNILYRNAIKKLPYEGLLLSRQGNRVTLNLGRSDGLVKDQIVTAVQIISANRHPKFNFLLSTDKEILGRIKILKVDETLSFGAIISEKERGAIRRMAKISGLDQVKYPEPESLDAQAGGSSLSDRPDSALTFGKDPKEWLPVRPPSFGQVGIALGLGTYTSSMKLASRNLEANSSFAPSLSVNGELWLSPEWTVRADLMQGVLATSNPRADSSPSTLNHAMSRYSLAIGYNFLLRDDFFGPKLMLSAGFASYRMFVDDSEPRTLTTSTFSGAVLGLGGSFPLTPDKEWYLGGRLNLFLMPSFSETPVSSGGSPNATINDFTLYGEKKIAENLRATLSIDFSLYSVTFSGNGNRTDSGGTPEAASSSSQRHTSGTAGITYMF